MSRRPRQSGFTLLETIVAFAITSGTLALLYQIHAQSTRTISLATEYGLASELAQSLLAESASSPDGPQLERSGIAEDKFRWTARSEPYEPSFGPDANRPARQSYDLSLRRITVEIAWGSGERERTFALETLKPVVRTIGETGP